jgi:glycosyltransferase involved in cell wall biosynthesis
MSFPSISIIMSVKDSESTLERAICSTLKDMKRGDELLVYDDGSVDNSIKKVMSIADPRIKLFCSSENLGLASRLNELVMVSKNDFIARMDSDDVTIFGRFKSQLKTFERDVELDAVFTSRLNFGPKLRNYRPSNFAEISKLHFSKSLLKSNPVAHSTAMFKKSSILRTGLYRNSPAEDYDLWMRMACQGMSLKKIRYPGIAYRLHQNQITRHSEWQKKIQLDPLLEESHTQLAQVLGWSGRSVWNAMNSNENSVADNNLLKEFHDFCRKI